MNRRINDNQIHLKSQELRYIKRECELLNLSRAGGSTLRAVLRDSLPFDFWHKIVDEFTGEFIDKAIDEISDEVVDMIIDEAVCKAVDEVDEEIACEVIGCVERLLSEIEREGGDFS